MKRIEAAKCWACRVRDAGNDLGGPFSAYCLECQPWPDRKARERALAGR